MFDGHLDFSPVSCKDRRSPRLWAGGGGLVGSLSVVGLMVYPVKSCAGISMTSAAVRSRGFQYDRQWMLVGPDGTFLSQRTHPAMARIEVAVAHNALRLHHHDLPQLVLPLSGNAGKEIPVRVHEHATVGVEQGREAAQWCSYAIGADARLVRMPNDAVRAIPGAQVAGAQTGYADAYPLLLASQASLHALNARIAAHGGVPVPMDRFRPNIVIGGRCDPHAEDTWKRIRIGGIELVNEGPCTRCEITMVDQATGAKFRDVEPLRTLNEYRAVRLPNGKRKTLFGANFSHRGTGLLLVGDDVGVLEVGTPTLVPEPARVAV